MKLYEFGPTRSARCRWLLQEMGVPFEAINGRAIMRAPEYAKVHPLQKLPALEDNGRTLIESAAICNYLADKYSEKGLIAKPGTWERALHDQWTYFALTEMEAYLWLNAKHTRIYAEEKRVPQILEPNNREFLAAAAVLEKALASEDYLVGGKFSVTDIVVGYTVNWGRMAGLLGDFPNLNRYLDRLFERPHCTLNQEGRKQ